MARLSLRWLSVAAMEAEGFTEEEGFTEVEDFTEADSGAEDFMEEVDSMEAPGFTGEEDSEAERFVAAVGFAGELAFGEERSATVFVEASGEVFVVTASGTVSADGVGADAAGVGVDGEIGMIGAGVGA